ncbi:MAG: cytochrome C [Epsilonproteobacteria bacterium]|nr:cytochrome C [Campylobacterota bacterium]NPA57127.1 cytochrome C [Campylobacterota bacterium]
MHYLLPLILIVSSLSAGNSCLTCHRGIEDIRDPQSQMAREIAQVARRAGYPGNSCIVCHGGDPEATEKGEAHRGSPETLKEMGGPAEFYPDPGSQWINDRTCGQCHKEQVAAQWTSLMNTEAGKIQGILWSFGAMEGKEHRFGNYTLTNLLHRRFGTESYNRYMEKVAEENGGVFPKKMEELPPAPTAAEVEKEPKLAAYTYLRQECLRCHTASKGRSRRGDYRGMGCSSCHIPYSNNGFYEGRDPTIPKGEPGHLLTHQIQGGRDARVHIHGRSYSGIPVETCTTCHNRGKRIGVSYQGLMETPYNPPFDSHGNPQPKLHTKHYLHMAEDVHYRKGMICQDCHTSLEAHGDGFLAGTTLASVEIECEDCHGTTKKYPWELPLGYGEEFGKELPKEGRGVAWTLADYLKKGESYEPRDGYLLTARGNPFGNVVREGKRVIVHLASGKDLTLTPLKGLVEEGKMSPVGMVAMDQIGSHTEKMECYACHDTWAPQCYGCHVKIDYSQGRRGVDWLAAAHDHDIHGRDGGKRGNLRDYLIDGEVVETRSYLRWEDPILGINGEGRIAPLIPGCQVTITVIGRDGKALLQNHIFTVTDNNRSVLAIDMAPVHSHTVQKEARSCESCHNNPKTMGFGIGGGNLLAPPNRELIVDLMDGEGRVIPKKITPQNPPIPALSFDWSTVIDRNMTQLVTVGHHWELSRALGREELLKLDRRGVCLGCHKTIPDRDLAVSLLSHIAQWSSVTIDRETHSSLLQKNLLMGAWLQVGLLAVLIGGGGYLLFRVRRRQEN